jgi:hypothetical protein
MSVSTNNLAYWLAHPLTGREIRLLRAIDTGRHRWRSDTFYEAYLIALDCIAPDYETKSLRVTEKGREAIEFFA